MRYKFHKPKIGTTLIASLFVLSLLILDILYLFPSYKFVSIILGVPLFVLFLFLFIPILRFQRVCVVNDNIVIRCFGLTYILSFAESYYETYKGKSFRFHYKNRYFQISPSGYSDGEELHNSLIEVRERLAELKLLEGED